jgi:hypothetical protein
MNNLQKFIYFIIAVKVVYLILELINFCMRLKGRKNTTKYNQIKYWKEKIAFLFKILMSIFLIYVFYPKVKRSDNLDKESKILLYLFGIILIISADWNGFIRDSVKTTNSETKFSNYPAVKIE